MTSGLELPGGWEVEPPDHVYRRSFLSDNRFKISNPVQNFKHFDIWPPVLLGQFQHCMTLACYINAGYSTLCILSLIVFYWCMLLLVAGAILMREGRGEASLRPQCPPPSPKERKFVLSIIRHLGWKFCICHVKTTYNYFIMSKLDIWTYDQQNFSGVWPYSQIHGPSLPEVKAPTPPPLPPPPSSSFYSPEIQIHKDWWKEHSWQDIPGSKSTYSIP